MKTTNTGGFQNAAKQSLEPTIVGNKKFLNIGDATELSIALLPDLNGDNPDYFSVQVFKHRATINGQRSTIPCLKQYTDEAGLQEHCPACAVSQTFYQIGENANGSAMYRKAEHVINVKVVADNSEPNPETGTNQLGKIGQMRVTYQVWNALVSGLADPELSDVDFTDLKTALPFIIRKTEQGGFPNYSTSGFGRKPLKMSDKDIKECMDNIKDLSDFLPEKPSEDVMEQWTTAAVTQLNGGAPLVAESNKPHEQVAMEATDVLETIRQRKAANAAKREA